MTDSSGLTALALLARHVTAPDAPVGLTAPPSDESGPALAGPLVSCAISVDTPLSGDQIRANWFRFPSANLVESAAGLFPDAVRSAATVTPERVKLLRKYRDAEGVEYTSVFYGPEVADWNTDREGPVGSVTVAPGYVKLSRFDPARRERALANRQTGEVAATRGIVCEWTSKSQARMMLTIRALDLQAFVAGLVPVMVTLTLPGDWLAVAPDAATVQQAFKRFKDKFRFAFGAPHWLWKREFQRRGAPHWHLWMIPPLRMRGSANWNEGYQGPNVPVGVDEFADWIAHAWTDALRPAGAVCHPWKEGQYYCVCSERCRSLIAGTDVRSGEGMDARDPQRLAVYFLKESNGGDSKAYQNSVPLAWYDGGLAAGASGPFPEKWVLSQSVGRFWGVTGLSQAVTVVDVDDTEKIWRSMAAVRVVMPRIHKIEVPGGQIRRILPPPSRVVRTVPRHKFVALDRETEVIYGGTGFPEDGDEVYTVDQGAHVGERVRRVEYRDKRRPVSRRIKFKQRAGWVGVNDGPAYASQIARYVGQLAGATSVAPAYARPLREDLAMRLRALRQAHPSGVAGSPWSSGASELAWPAQQELHMSAAEYHERFTRKGGTK